MAGPIPLWAVQAGVAGIGALAKGFKADSARKKGLAYADKLQDLSKVTPSEREYLKRQREIASSGDPLLQEQFRKGIQTSRQVGAEQLQRAEGSIISQGLEDSIVAQNIRRKVSDQTLKSVSEQARALAQANMVAKREAEERILRMEMGIEDRERSAQLQANQIKSGLPSQKSIIGDTLFNLAQVGLGSYVQNRAQQDAVVKELDMYEAKKKINQQYPEYSGYEDVDWHPSLAIKTESPGYKEGYIWNGFKYVPTGSPEHIKYLKDR